MKTYIVRFMPYSETGEQVFLETHEYISPNIDRACEWAIAYGSDDLFYKKGDRSEWLVTVVVRESCKMNCRYLTFSPTHPPKPSAFKKWERPNEHCHRIA